MNNQPFAHYINKYHMLQFLFLLLKDIDNSSLNDVLSQNDLYGKLDPSDLASLPKINLDNFVNICNFVDYYQLIDETEFITNIQYHILCKHKEVINNINKTPLNIQQKVYKNECLTEMKCHICNIKHIACYKFSKHNNGSINYSIVNAIFDGNLEMVKYLFKIGQDYEQFTIDWKKHAIDWASRNGHLEIVKYFFEIDIKCTTRAIDMACLNGRLEVIKYLFEVKHQDCTVCAINWGGYNGHLEVVKYLIEFQNKKYTQETLDWSRRNNEIVQYLKLHPDSFI